MKLQRIICPVVVFLMTIANSIVFAGNVRMYSHPRYPGILFFEGTNTNDDLQFSQSGTGFGWVRGRNGTTINGQSGIRFALPPSEININGFGGTDITEITGLVFPRRFSFNGGSGADQFNILGSTLGEVLFDAEAGTSEWFSASQTSFDRLSIAVLSTNRSNSSLINCKIKGELLVRGGSGIDSFYLTSTTVGGQVSVNVGDGSKPSSAETISMNGLTASGYVNIEAGNAASTVTLTNGQSKSLRVLMGNADGDVVRLDGFWTGNAELSGGAGARDWLQTPRSKITARTVRDFEIVQ